MSFPYWVYPDILTDIKSGLPFEHSEGYDVLNTEYVNGIEQRRLLKSTVNRGVHLTYPVLAFAAVNYIRRFYESKQGSFQSFSFYYPQIETYENEVVGVATASTGTTMRLPSVAAQTVTLYRDGVDMGFDWTFVSGGGLDGEDQAILNVAQVAGALYTYDFTGRLRINARFSEDPFILSETKDLAAFFVVDLKGLEPRP